MLMPMRPPLQRLRSQHPSALSRAFPVFPANKNAERAEDEEETKKLPAVPYEPTVTNHANSHP